MAESPGGTTAQGGMGVIKEQDPFDAIVVAARKGKSMKAMDQWSIRDKVHEQAREMKTSLLHLFRQKGAAPGQECGTMTYTALRDTIREDLQLNSRALTGSMIAKLCAFVDKDQTGVLDVTRLCSVLRVTEPRPTPDTGPRPHTASGVSNSSAGRRSPRDAKEMLRPSTSAGLARMKEEADVPKEAQKPFKAQDITHRNSPHGTEEIIRPRTPAALSHEEAAVSERIPVPSEAHDIMSRHSPHDTKEILRPRTSSGLTHKEHKALMSQQSPATSEAQDGSQRKAWGHNVEQAELRQDMRTLQLMLDREKASSLSLRSELARITEQLVLERKEAAAKHITAQAELEKLRLQLFEMKSSEEVRQKQQRAIQDREQHSSESATYRNKVMKGGVRLIPKSENVGVEELASLVKELKNMDGLINGLNSENKRLHGLVKGKQQQDKAMRCEMAMENSKLRKQLEEAKLENRKAMGLSLRASLPERLRVEHALERQLVEQKNTFETKMLQQKEAFNAERAELQNQIDRIRRTKREAEMRKEGLQPDALRKEQDVISSLRATMEAMNESHESKTKQLSDKLAWYMENQGLINDYETRQREQEAAIQDLTLRLAHLNARGGVRGPIVHVEPAKVQGGSKGGGRGGVGSRLQSKKIRELEKQVEELQTALEKNNPNSITSLVRAARPDTEEIEAVRRLEEEKKVLQDKFVAHEAESSANLRSLRQLFDRSKALNKKKVAELKGQLERLKKRTGGKKSPAVLEAQKKLNDMRAYYKKKLAEVKSKRGVAVPVAAGSRKGSSRDKKCSSEIKEQKALVPVGLGEASEVTQLRQELERYRSQEEKRSGKGGQNNSEREQELRSKLEEAERQLQQQLEKLEESERELREAQAKARAAEALSRRKAELNERAAKRTAAAVKNMSGLTSTQEFQQQLNQVCKAYEGQIRDLKEAKAHLQRRSEQRDAELNARLREAATQREKTNRRLLEMEFELSRNAESPSTMRYQALLVKINSMQGRFEAREKALQQAILAASQRSEEDFEAQRLQHARVLAAKDAEIRRFGSELSKLLEALSSLKAERRKRGAQHFMGPKVERDDIF